MRVNLKKNEGQRGQRCCSTGSNHSCSQLSAVYTQCQLISQEHLYVLHLLDKLAKHNKYEFGDLSGFDAPQNKMFTWLCQFFVCTQLCVTNTKYIQ